jgi:integrase
VKRDRLPSCPLCRGPLTDSVERRQELKAGFKTKREAEDALGKVNVSVSGGTYIEPSKLLVRDYLKDEWLPAIKSTVRATTYLSYKGHVEIHINPELGRFPLQKLTGAHINAFYSKLMSEKKTVGEEEMPKYAPATVRRVHATLHRALRDAVRWNHLQRSPADSADPPRVSASDTEMKTWAASQLQTFLRSERESRLYPLWLLLATTGMRRGEVLGLKWDDVDFAARRIAVRRTRVVTGYECQVSEPKTRRGRRLIALDQATAAALGSLRTTQKKERLAWGPAWKDTGYVFILENGEPYHPERVSKLFAQAAKQAGLPRIRLHDLRHTYATLALSAGVHPKVISERLGHASIAITLDCYSHCLPTLSEEAAARVAALVVPG